VQFETRPQAIAEAGFESSLETIELSMLPEPPVLKATLVPEL
jgi:hypothetical protein